jgi:alpha-mannosidase
MNNYWDTNYRASEGGHFTFHYVVTSAPSTDPAALSRLGWEEITPLEADIITSQDKAAITSTQGQANGEGQPSSVPANLNSSLSLDAKQQGFLVVDDPNVLLETMKPAEDGNGTILRFLDFGGTERTVTVRIPYLHLDHAWQTDAVERNQAVMSIAADGQLHFTVHPNEIVTIRVTERDK